jgi:hypothetical protein
MNERIKELWNKAAESTAAFPSGQNNSWETQVNFLDKFAELIVRECINKCDAKRAEYTKLSKDADNFADKNLWAEGEISAHRIRISIQEHFGVES